MCVRTVPAGNLSRKGGWIIDTLLYKGLKGKARTHTDDLIPKTRLCTNNSLHGISATIEAYNVGSYPRLSGTGMTSLTLFSTAEMSDDYVCPSSLPSCIL